METETQQHDSDTTTLGDQLAEVVAAEKVEETTALAIKDGFSDFIAQAEGWEEKALAVNVTDISQTAEMKQARESRLALRQIRIGIEKKHKEVKEDALKRCKAIDAAKRFLVGKIAPLEEHLKIQEEFADRYMEEQRQRRIAERAAQLRAETDFDPDDMNLDTTDEKFAAVLQQGRDAKAARIERERQEEQERIERERREKLYRERMDLIRPYGSFADGDLDAYDLPAMEEEAFRALLEDLKARKQAYEEEQERIRKENERLKAEAEERERKAEEERKRREAEEAKRREEERRAEEARQAAHKKTLSRQIAMKEVNGPTDYDELAAMTDGEFDARHGAAEKAFREAQEEERRKEEAERQERERKEAEAKAKREAEEAQKREQEESLKASITRAAAHAAAIVEETAETWAKRHPEVENGAGEFVAAVIARLKGGAE